MFPLRALHGSARTPWMTRSLTFACIAVFLWQVLAGGASYGIEALGARPMCVIAPGACGVSALHATREWLFPVLASIFLHGGVLHLAFNMWFLWVFGPAVEDKLGSFKFLLFYLACGLAASLAHILTQPFSSVPVVGASGAIAGVLGAFLVWQPKGWILSYIPPFWFLPVPAPLFLVLWAGSQIAGVFGMWSGSGEGNIAWLAHLGGFAFGALYAWKRKPRRKKRAALV